ncbi:MAG TPA: hypothetical protein ENK88_05630 [Campylobacterales bacterium]|nr:hypothetical protein [Campylobacterales bacterium]
MKGELTIPDKKIVKLAKGLSNNLSIDFDDAMILIYKDWDNIEKLFKAHKKVKAVLHHFILEIENGTI